MVRKLQVSGEESCIERLSLIHKDELLLIESCNSDLPHAKRLQASTWTLST